MVESIYFLKPAWCGTHFAGLWPEQGLQPVTKATALRRWFSLMPSVYAPCSTCHGSRYNAKTLEIQYRGKNIAEVLTLTVDSATQFFSEHAQVSHALAVLQEVGLGYLRLGQPATELSGGEAQRIKLATELQRNQRGNTLYILDEPTTGLHPSDVQRLVAQLDGLVAKGNT
jgi:excinuclease ABC subunit A